MSLQEKPEPNFDEEILSKIKQKFCFHFLHGNILVLVHFLFSNGNRNDG
jgi:hypothetical protein